MAFFDSCEDMYFFCLPFSPVFYSLCWILLSILEFNDCELVNAFVPDKTVWLLQPSVIATSGDFSNSARWTLNLLRGRWYIYLSPLKKFLGTAYTENVSAIHHLCPPTHSLSLFIYHLFAKKNYWCYLFAKKIF